MKSSADDVVCMDDSGHEMTLNEASYLPVYHLRYFSHFLYLRITSSFAASLSVILLLSVQLFFSGELEQFLLTPFIWLCYVSER